MTISIPLVFWLGAAPRTTSLVVVFVRLVKNPDGKSSLCPRSSHKKSAVLDLSITADYMSFTWVPVRSILLVFHLRSLVGYNVNFHDEVTPTAALSFWPSFPFNCDLLT
mmetsp:Transcript_11598/g.26838  ORF Transcript_11598/g.26838 Transcript_11598/m.26838 type:complete len:109 (+) Transcript_11598:89-415(+)